MEQVEEAAKALHVARDRLRSLIVEAKWALPSACAEVHCGISYHPSARHGNGPFFWVQALDEDPKVRVSAADAEAIVKARRIFDAWLSGELPELPANPFEKAAA